jgi:hypothetical protein
MGSVARHETKYFEYKVSANQLSSELSVVVTPLGGDPDVYVSLVNAHPNRSNPSSYEYSSFMYGGDRVVIPPTAALANRMVYIAVYGYTAATFTVTVRNMLRYSPCTI